MAELSVFDQIMMNNLDLKSTLMQNMFSTSSALASLQKSITSKNNMADAVEGDKKYDEEMDANSDGTVTYNEYVKYISSQNLKKYNLPENSTTFKSIFDSESGMTKPQILNLGKALSSYITNSALLPQGIISKEA